MKILDKSELHGSAENAQSHVADTGKKNIDLTAYRRKKKKNKHLVKLIIILLAVIAFAIVWINADTIFEPLRGIASRINTKTSYDVGFPIELPGSSGYDIEKNGEGFSLLTDTYLYSYSTSGEQLYAKKHGYTNPEQATSDKRVLLFDKLGFTFALYSRSSLLYQKTLDDKIIYASTGNDGLSAVVTTSSRYSNILYIYDDSGNWKYTRKFADENVMQVGFIGDGEHIAVSTVSSSGGNIITNFYKFSIKNQDGKLWSYSVSNNSIPCGMYADRNTIMAVCDNLVVSIDANTGALLGKHSYTGILRYFSISPERTVLQYSDISSSKNVVLLLNSRSEPITAATASSSNAFVGCDGDGIYVLDGTHFKAYDDDLLNNTDIQLPNEGYTKFVKVGDKIFLLGYQTIGLAEL